MHTTLVSTWTVLGLLLCVLMAEQVHGTAKSGVVQKGGKRRREEQHAAGSGSGSLSQPIRISGHQTSEKTRRECASLNKFITCFEEVEFHGQPGSMPRSFSEVYDSALVNEGIIELDFDAFNTSFHLRLYPSARDGVVPETLNLTAISSTSQVSRGLHTSQLQYYHGYLPRATAASHGTFLYDAVFDGVFHTAAAGSFYMEPASRYFPKHTAMTGRSMAVIYRSMDIKFDKKSSKTLDLSLSNGRVFPGPGSHFHHPFPRADRAHGGTLSKNLKICELHVVSDHTFFEYKAQSSLARVLAEIIYYITEADEIFRTTDFDGDGQGDNIGFMVTDITVYESSDADDYRLGNVGLSVDSILKAFSTYEFDKFCLSLLLTQRDYAKGVVGLAWFAKSSPYSPPGGICQKRAYINSDTVIPGHYNFNTALVSMLNYGHVLPREIGALTVAHEFGHSFGAPHDDLNQPRCSPGGKQGQYIMHPYTSHGNKPNNDRFSTCSIMHMWPVIQSKGSCLRRQYGPICGNRRLEEGEECDCGHAALCEENSCCTPPLTPGDGTGCLLRAGKACSANAPCCTDTCEIVSTPDVCSPSTGCTMASVCSGFHATCPKAEHRPDGTTCSNIGGTGTCFKGRCMVAFCRELGLRECQCSSDVFADTKLCEICCQCPHDSNSACVPLSVLGIYHGDGNVIYQSAGQPCEEYKGYCTVDHHCETMGYEDAIIRLNNMFKKSSQDTTNQWIQNHWYYVVVAAAGAALIIAISRECRKKEGPDALGYRTGKMAVLWQHAEEELQRVERQLADLCDIRRRKLTEIDRSKPQPVDSVVALARIIAFFPSVPRSTIVRVVQSSTTEEFAVRQLLLEEQPIRKLVEN